MCQWGGFWAGNSGPRECWWPARSGHLQGPGPGPMAGASNRHWWCLMRKALILLLIVLLAGAPLAAVVGRAEGEGVWTGRGRKNGAPGVMPHRQQRAAGPHSGGGGLPREPNKKIMLRYTIPDIIRPIPPATLTSLREVKLACEARTGSTTVKLRTLEDAHVELAGKAGGGKGLTPGECFASHKQGTVYCVPIAGIIGAQKSGTTVLSKTLLNPCLHRTHHEVHYFDHVASTRDLQARWREYVRRFPVRPDLVTSGMVPFFTDKSPNYTMAGHNAAKYASMLLPSLPSIMMLRNPSSRAYSSFQHQCTRRSIRLHATTGHPIFCDKDYVSAPACAAARVAHPCPPEMFAAHLEHSHHVEREWRAHWDSMLADPGVDPGGFITRSYFRPQIEHWARHFPNEQMLLMFNEDMMLDTVGALKIAADYLNLPHQFAPIYYSVSKHKPMNDETRTQLDVHYCEHNRALQELLGIPFPTGWACAETRSVASPVDPATVHWVVSPVRLAGIGTAEGVRAVSASGDPAVLVARLLPNR